MSLAVADRTPLTEQEVIEAHEIRGPLARAEKWWILRSKWLRWTVLGLLLAAVATIGIADHFSKPYAPLYGYGGTGSTTHTFSICTSVTQAGCQAKGAAILPIHSVATSTTGSVIVADLVIKDPLNATITVTGQKCSSAKTLINTKVDKQWISLEPPGQIIDAPVPKLVQRPPGCYPAPITSQAPAGVIAVVKDLAQHGQRISVWKIEGGEEPVAPDGKMAVWQSSSFAIDYEGPT